MAEENKSTPKPAAEENKSTPKPAGATSAPSAKEAKSIMEEYQNASPKDQAKNFFVDKSTRTLRRK